MKIKPGFKLRSVAGQNIVVPIGDAAIDFNGMISLNESGAFLFKALLEDTTEDKLAAALLDEYDVSLDCAKEDVAAFLNKMREAKLLDE
jgi:hypothetical protein